MYFYDSVLIPFSLKSFPLNSKVYRRPGGFTVGVKGNGGSVELLTTANELNALFILVHINIHSPFHLIEDLTCRNIYSII